MGNFRIIEPDYTNIEKAFKDLKSGFKNEYSQNLKATLFKGTFRLEVKVTNFVDEDECIGFVEGYGFQYLHKTGNSLWFEYPEGQVADSKHIKDANFGDKYGSARIYKSIWGSSEPWVVEENNSGCASYSHFKTFEEAYNSAKNKRVINVDENDYFEEFGKPFKGVSDSRRIKDANDTPDVLDGILMIAFNDGEEEDGYNEVKSHANEQGEIGGVKYETYDTDNQDGVTLIDLCALTNDANAFVKALLNEWGVIDSVADIEFEASENMQEVSDSHKVKDDMFFGNTYGYDYEDEEGGDYLVYDFDGCEMKYFVNKDDAIDFCERNSYARGVMDYEGNTIWKKGKGWVSDSRRVSDMIKPAHLRGYAINQRKKRRGGENPDKLSRVEGDVLDENMDSNGIYDSHRVSDMTKPAHLRGYAERYRQKRRAKQGQVSREEKVDEDDTIDKGNIADSRDARFFVYKNRQDVTPDKEGFLKKADAIAFAKTMLDDNDRTMVEVYRYDENDDWGDVEQVVWTSNNQPKTDLEYWGVKEVEIKKVKEGDYFTLKPIPEPKESQVWVKGGYDRAYKEYEAYKFSDVNSYRGFKANKKVYVGFIF